MSALIVYESMFGNTRDVAQAVADGLAPHLPVRVVEVASAPTTLDDVDLLVVGGPTHAFGMSREGTRADAATRGARSVISRGLGIREWLATVRTPATPSLPAATFDTKTAKPRLPGSAAVAARRQLKRRGFRPVLGPASFSVTGMTGPLLAGERERARAWGDELGSSIRRLAGAS